MLHQSGLTILDGASYTYDASGNRTAKTDYQANVTTNYAYDAIYQLLQATQGTTTSESYTYDAVGNRLSSLGMSPYQYNSSNELTSTPTTTYTYDKDGELATKVDSTGTTTYNWNTLNRLMSVVLPGSGGTVTFKYDPFGRRIQKSTASTTTNYLCTGDNLVEEVDGSGNVLARYTQGRTIDEPLAELRSGTTSYYEQDGVSAVSSLSNAAGALANTYVFDSFGKLTASTGTLVNPFQYTAREFDPETGIYDYRMRYYDPNIGRFVSEDPLGFKGGDPNFYAYVLNSPTGLVDPLGLQHTPGGPRHPEPQPDGTIRCNACPNRTQGDSCEVIMAKMTQIAITLASHVLWDWEHEGTKHSTTDLYSWQGAFRRCLEMFKKYCVKDCPKQKLPEPPIQPWVPPFPIPDPFPVIIDPCILNPGASYCGGPSA